MSLRRLALTSTGMGLLALALAVLTPRPGELVAVLTAPQTVVDTAGADAVVLAGCAALAWAAWAWGALGLALTAASAIPGVLGSAARVALRILLPAGARRAATLALGLGLGLGLGMSGPWSAVASPPTGAPVPDWPSASPAGAPGQPVPDRPGPPAAGAHPVVPGDCLWDIAADRLESTTGRPATDREIAAAVQAWWTTNADVIGPDPDLIFPGQVLRPPAQP